MGQKGVSQTGAPAGRRRACIPRRATLTVGKGEKITSQHKISNRELCPGEEMEVKHFQVAQPRVLPHQEVLLQVVFR